jgi:HEPN domain-containing protein
MDTEEHIRYWKNSAQEDLDAAASLLEKQHVRHSMFFAHLALEKVMKAHVTRRTQQVPPRIHNLIRLAQMAELTLDSKQMDFLREFGVYQVEGRYPDSQQIAMDESLVKTELSKAREMVEWLLRQL